MNSSVENISDPLETRVAVAGDSVRGVFPRVVVEPRDDVEVGALLKDANASGLAVLPRGGGTKLDWGNRPRRADMVLSTARLNRVVEHAWADLTVTVQAGCTIRTLQDTLHVHGQRVAVDPLWPDRATVGGVLSTNDTGALRLRFGGLRDLVIGLTLALPDGTLASSGGKVVKNVAGYDLSKLATGALGTLGVITRAVFRLHPLPQQARTWSAAFTSLPEALRLVDAIQDSKLAHTSLQVRVSSASPPAVDMLLEGSAAGIASQALQARALAGGTALEESSAAVWSAREDLWSPGERGPVVKISVPLTEVVKTVEIVQRVAGAEHLTWEAVIQATGLGWIRFDGTPATWSAVIGPLRSAAEREGGSLVILRPPLPEDPCDAWGDIGDAQPLMTAVKRQFDPKSTLNPGRFVGGI